MKKPGRNQEAIFLDGLIFEFFESLCKNKELQCFQNDGLKKVTFFFIREIFAFNMWKSSFWMEKYYYLYFYKLNAESPIAFQCGRECDNITQQL